MFCLNYKASVNDRFSTRYVITVTHITKDGLGNAKVLDPARANIPANEIFLGIGGRYAD